MRKRSPSATRGRLARVQRVALLVVAALIAACSPPESGGPMAGGSGQASDPVQEAATLEALLRDFLADTEVASVHDRFWAEELIYTSSDGTRRGKAEIMAGFEPGDGAAEAPEEPAPAYSAEDVDIRVYGDAAVVAFRLVITPPESSAASPGFNWNTGTFLKRDGEWRAVAWQSTRGSDGAP